MAEQTLEQQRAQDAWKCCEGCDDAYVKLAKGVPALIMNSGLMQVTAFLHDKGNGKKDDPHEKLAGHLQDWLHRRFDLPSDFAGFMDGLLKAESTRYQAVTTEALAWLKWLRQMAPARRGSG